MAAPADQLTRRIVLAQDHVLAAVEGLEMEGLERRAAPSGWTVATLLAHLAYDVETFWVHAVLGGRREAIADLRDGWGATTNDPVGTYRRAAVVSREILAGVSLDAEPAWWPAAEMFDGLTYECGWEVAMHVLVELSTHAGHLDMAREAIDGHQHLVL